MPLSERKNQQILEILDNILSYHSAAFFDHPVDPERDQVPTYYTVVKHPMDLGTIRNKIENNEYNNVASFIADVELVWSNAILFNGRNSFMYFIVRYLQTKFKEQTEFLTDDVRKDWINQMNDLRNKVSTIISNPPYLISKELGPSALKSHHSNPSLLQSNSVSSIPTSYASEGSVNASYSSANIASNTKSRSSSAKNRSTSTSSSSSSSRNRRKFSNISDDEDVDDAENSNQHSEKKSGHVYYGFDADDGYDNDDDDDEAAVSSRWNKKSASRSSSKKSSKTKPSSSSQKKSSSSSSKTKKSSSSSSVTVSAKSRSEPDLTEDEIEKLANDVNQLAADDDKNSEIAELLQSMEPQLSFDEEVGVDKLSKPTLIALKKLVNRLMKI